MLIILECLKEGNIESKGGVQYLGSDYLNGSHYFFYIIITFLLWGWLYG